MDSSNSTKTCVGGVRLTHQRTLRWYEWILLLLILTLAGGVRAASVYQCVDAQGGKTFQSLPCPDAQQQSLVTLDRAPAYAPSPAYAIAAGHDDNTRRDNTHRVAHESAKEHGAAKLPMSYECRVADGRVFYRHSACPRSLAADDPSSGRISGHGKDSNHGGSGHAGSGSSSSSQSVSSRRVSHDEACEKIHSASAIGRSGHEHDEDVSTYERNLGHDPCHQGSGRS